ncbi:hypothetical protein T10_12032 [Trichinella papuae]|uniref:Uncharacterized protein n=1 Tax=Trichinella papuae TaxID=268474 RepID=A0A0V1MC83_9BILA|nr:hypothetical protein T10_12032 [Trichinella papuae]
MQFDSQHNSSSAINPKPKKLTYAPALLFKIHNSRYAITAQAVFSGDANLEYSDQTLNIPMDSVSGFCAFIRLLGTHVDWK